MTITARYPGKCSVCGGRIHAGAQVEWTKGSPARHVKCASREVEATKAEPGPIALSGGSGYSCQGWTVGQVLLAGEERRRAGGPDALVIVTASRQYVRDEGLSFGVGADEGYLYRATARPATPEELAMAVDAAHGRALTIERELELARVYAALEAGERLAEVDADRLVSAKSESIALTTGNAGVRWVLVEADALVLLDGGHYDDYRRSAWRSARTVDLERRVRALAIG